jgi:hypothetical protein
MTYRAIRAGFRVVEVPIVFRERRVGASKMTGLIVTEAIWRVPALRFVGRGSDSSNAGTTMRRRYTL